MVAPLTIPESITVTYDEATLVQLSLAQNGAAQLVTVYDADGNRAGYESYYTIDLTKYVAPAVNAATQALLDYASDKQNVILAQSWTFNVAGSGATAHNVTTKLDAGGQLAMMKLGIWVGMNAGASSPPSMPYNNVDSSTTTLTFAEVQSLVAQTGALNIKSYAVLNPVCDKIRAGTIQTRTDVDAALAAITP